MAVTKKQWIQARSNTTSYSAPTKRTRPTRSTSGTRDVNDGGGSYDPVTTGKGPRTGTSPGGTTQYSAAAASRATAAQRKAARMKRREAAKAENRADRMARRGGPEGYQGPEAEPGGIYTASSPEYTGADAQAILRLNSRFKRGTRSATWLNENASGILARYGGAQGYRQFLLGQSEMGPGQDFRREEGLFNKTPDKVKGTFDAPRPGEVRHTPAWYRAQNSPAEVPAGGVQTGAQPPADGGGQNFMQRGSQPPVREADLKAQGVPGPSTGIAADEPALGQWVQQEAMAGNSASEILAKLKSSGLRYMFVPGGVNWSEADTGGMFSYRSGWGWMEQYINDKMRPPQPAVREPDISGLTIPG